jgi:thioredoxin-like negative regulator of GroEL
MKITRRQLRKMINETANQYGQGMAQQSAIAKKASFPAADEVIDGLLRVVGNDGNFETQMARDAILALQDVESADELMSSLADVEGYIADALRARIEAKP